MHRGRVCMQLHAANLGYATASYGHVISLKASILHWGNFSALTSRRRYFCAQKCIS